MKQLFEKTLHLTAKDDRTNVLMHFRVPRPFDRLEIHVSYSPKTIEDETAAREAAMSCYRRYLLPEDVPAEVRPSDLPVKNLLTLSLDCENTYVGAAHRQSPDQTFVISKTSASPGFHPVPIVRSLWRAIVSVHALAAGEADYSITVIGKESREP